MRIIKEYRSELWIAGMMLLEAITIFFPTIFPAGFSEIVLSCLLVIFLLHRLHIADLALKRKYN